MEAALGEISFQIWIAIFLGYAIGVSHGIIITEWGYRKARLQAEKEAKRAARAAEREARAAGKLIEGQSVNTPAAARYLSRLRSWRSLGRRGLDTA